MNLEIKYRGRVITGKDISFINQLIAENRCDNRWRLSKKLCMAWNWVQANGTLCDMVCRGLMLKLHRAGHIRLPARQRIVDNPFINRKKPSKVKIDQSPVQTYLSEIRPLKFLQVRRTPLEKLFNSLIEHYHYLGYCHPVGEQLKYIVFAGERPVACMAWSSAPRHIGVRDRVRLSDCFLKTGRGFIIILFITLRHLLIKIDLPGPAIKLPTGFILVTPQAVEKMIRQTNRIDQ